MGECKILTWIARLRLTFARAGSWYRSSELATRGAIFSSTAQIAGIFSGVLQSESFHPRENPVVVTEWHLAGAIHTSMDGLAGCAGWQWQFLICT